MPILVASAFVADRGVGFRAFGIFPALLAVGVWTGRRLAQVLTRGYAGLGMLAASGIVFLALIEPSAPFTVVAFRYVIPRMAGLSVMSVLAIFGWWQWRLLGRRDVVADFARASW